MNVLQSTAAAAERVFEFLEEPEQTPDKADSINIIDQNGNSTLKGQVTFENVVFGYTPEKTIIHNFNAYIKQGAQVAIVGPTGAGKATIV